MTPLTITSPPAEAAPASGIGPAAGTASGSLATATVDADAPPRGSGAEEAARQEFQRLKGRFLSSLNHEMRTPLTGILGMTDLLMETGLSVDQREYIAIMRTCAESLHDILNATLEFASLSSGQARREEAPFPLVPCLEAIAAEFSMKARAKGLSFSFHASGQLPDVVMGDEIRVRALLSQLLSNAVKFTIAGRIELRVVGHGSAEGPCWLDIDVLDTGIGIPADKMSRIFESFEQAESGISRQYQGLGLGLALARELAGLLNGEISVTSAVGEGSVFRLRLPIEPTLEAVPERHGAPQVSSPVVVAERPRILLVEDNRVSQRIVSHMLDKARYEADAVENGMAAIRAATERRYSLVLMDLLLPGIDGIETTYRLRRLPGYENTPVVALTANASSEFRELCRQNGLQGFLSKPVQSIDLVQTLQQFLPAPE
jgi:signal transduction histidine kinase/ActR/RegA family two-component response regulator